MLSIIDTIVARLDKYLTQLASAYVAFVYRRAA